MYREFEVNLGNIRLCLEKQKERKGGRDRMGRKKKRGEGKEGREGRRER